MRSSQSFQLVHPASVTPEFYSQSTAHSQHNTQRQSDQKNTSLHPTRSAVPSSLRARRASRTRRGQPAWRDHGCGRDVAVPRCNRGRRESVRRLRRARADEDAELSGNRVDRERAALAADDVDGPA